MSIIVDSRAGQLQAFGERFACVIGKGGAVPAAMKREGDGATPLGLWPVRAALLRPGRGFVPPSALPWRWLRPDDGWSDDPVDPDYNRPIRHPHRLSAERMWRDDAVYDVVIVVGHNDAPVVPGAGSAIFWHLTRPDRRPTEGCVAIGHEAMAYILPRLAASDRVRIAG